MAANKKNLTKKIVGRKKVLIGKIFHNSFCPIRRTGDQVNYRKYLMIAAIVSALIFPEYVFTGLGVVLLIVVILFFVVDIVFDIYIVAVYLIQWFREK